MSFLKQPLNGNENKKTIFFRKILGFFCCKKEKKKNILKFNW